MANKGKTNIYLIKTSQREEWSLTQVVGLVLEDAVACCGHDVSTEQSHSSDSFALARDDCVWPDLLSPLPGSRMQTQCHCLGRPEPATAPVLPPVRSQSWRVIK